MPGWLMLQASAARPKCPCSATASRYRRSRRFIGSARLLIVDIHHPDWRSELPSIFSGLLALCKEGATAGSAAWPLVPRTTAEKPNAPKAARPSATITKSGVRARSARADGRQTRDNAMAEPLPAVWRAVRVQVAALGDALLESVREITRFLMSALTRRAVRRPRRTMSSRCLTPAS